MKTVHKIGLVLLLLMLLMPVAMADVYVVNGMISDTPGKDRVPVVNVDRDYAIDTEYIDFDDMVCPCFFSQQVALTNEYASQGVIFSGEGEVLDECGNFGISNYSSPNFLAFNTGAGVSGPEDMLFDPPILDLTIFAGQANSGTITMNAYDASNTLVDSDVIVGTSTLQAMSVYAGGITRVQLSFTGTVACFDDLSFTQDLTPDLVVLIDPMVTEIPAGGGNVMFWVGVQNNTNFPITHAAWIMVQHVISGNSVEVRYYPSLTFPANSTIGTTLTQYIPGLAPGGPYLVYAYVGNHPWLPMYWNYFQAFKLGPAADGLNAFEHPELWETHEQIEPQVAWVGEDVAQPDKYGLGLAYPNPFNPSTTLTVTLPEAAELTVAVYNVTGQQVAELANGSFSAGSHTLTWDASHLASGLYFVRATVPGKLNQVQKVMYTR